MGDRSATTSRENDSGGMRWTGTSVMNRISSDFGFKAPFAPVSLASVAALTPPDIDVEIWDELTQPPVDESFAERGYDLGGVTGFHLHRPRALKIAQVFRNRGIPGAVGGPGVSSEPDEYRDAFDYLFIGEAEFTWPLFIRDYRAGRAKKEYRQIEKPELDKIPVPH
jgi:radical SAM superfamily enzyme YgiQ (UPF0313 family)